MEPIHRKGRTLFFLSLFRPITYRRSAIVASIFVVMLPVALVQSGETFGPRPEFLDALWVAEPENLEKIDIQSGDTLVQVAESYRKISIDPVRAVLWGFGDGKIEQLDFSGQILSTSQIDANETDRATVAIGVNHQDGTLFLGVGKRLYQVDTQGQPHLLREFGQNVVGAGIEPDHEMVWVATEKELAALEYSGSARFIVEFESDNKLRSLKSDPRSHLAWVATKDSVESFDLDGKMTKQYPLEGVNHLGVTKNGSIWAADDKQLSLIDSATETIAYQLFPFGGQGTIDALTTDMKNGQDVWVAQNKNVIRFSADGELKQQWQRSDPIRDLAAYADTVLPTLVFISPEEGTYLNSNRPAFKLEAKDLGIGVDYESISFMLNGEPAPRACQNTNELVTCTLDNSIDDGHAQLSAEVLDFSGNRSEPAIINFTVDTVAPEITVSSPVNGSITRVSQLTVLGILSESARVSVNGQSAPVDVNNQFQYGPLNLNEGNNTFNLVATDLAGNTGETVVSVFVDTTPPMVFPPPDRYVEATGPLTAVALGIASAVDNLSGGLVPVPSQQGPFSVGSHIVTWQAVDEAGNTGTASQSVTVADTTPPTVIAPADQTIEATATQTAVDLGTASALDLVDGELTPLPVPTGPFALGEHSVIWSATDSSGNTGTAAQTIRIIDTTAPTLSAPPDIAIESSSAPIPIDIGSAQASDLFEPVALSNDAPAEFPVGTTVVTWIAEDANGNKSTASQTVSLSVTQAANIWSEPQLLEHKEEPAYRPVVKTDSAGRAIAVWQQRMYSNGPWDAYASRFIGGQWTTPVLIEQFPDFIAFLDLALGPNGSATVIGRTDRTAWTVRFDPESGWQPAVEIGQTDWGVAVTYDQAGNTYAVGHANGEVWFRKQDESGAWSDATQLSFAQDDYDYDDEPKIVIDRSGNITVTWLHYGRDYANVQATRYTSRDGWGETRILGPQADWIYYHHIDVTLLGDVYISWAQGSSTDAYIESAWMAHHNADTGWQEPVQMDMGESIWSPHFALNASGNVVAAWIKRDGNAADVWTSMFDTATGWSTPVGLTNTPGWESEPRVAIDAKGKIVAVWLAEPTGENSDKFHLFGATYVSDQGWSAPQQISAGTTARLYDTPSLSINPSRQGFVVWPQLKDEFYWNGHDIWVSHVGEGGSVNAPNLYPPPDLIVEASAAPLSPVSLGEAQAFDAEGKVLIATPIPTGPLGLGAHLISWTTTDSSGRSASAIQTVVVRDTTPPALIPPADIDVSSPDGLVLGEPFTADIFGVAMVENDAPVQFPQGLTVVTWTATDNNGNTTTATQRVAVGIPFDLTIDTPVSGAYIDGDTVVVHGTITAPINTGVVVNGVAAVVLGGSHGAQYYAEIPVQPGANTIVVAATTESGATLERQLDITASGESPVELVLAQTSAVSPATVSIELRDRSTEAISKIEIDFNGDGVFDVETGDSETPAQYLYSVPGLYWVTVKTTFADGSVRTDKRLVAVDSVQNVDTMFTAIWNQFSAALVKGQIEVAGQYLDDAAKVRYEPVFVALLDKMPEIVAGQSAPYRVSTTAEIGEYAIVRRGEGKKQLFLVYFMRDPDGIWRLRSM